MSLRNIGRIANNNIENMIYDSIKSCNDNYDELIRMTAMMILNGINAKEHSADEIAVCFNTLTKQNSDSFGGVATYAYYITAIEINNDSLIKSNPSRELRQLANDVNKEIYRMKDILHAYLTARITKGPYVQELFNSMKIFGISNGFHDNLHDYLSPNQDDIIKQIADILMGR